MKELLNRFKIDLALLLLGWGLLAAAYSNALSVPFVWDDHGLIAQNPMLSQVNAWEQILDANFWALPHRKVSNAYYRPLVIASFAIDARLSGMDPYGFHRTNLLLHLINCGLLFALVRRAGAPSYAALLAMLLFGAMPRLTESVTWVSGRTDVLAALGASLAIALYRLEPKAWQWRAASALALFAGLLGKEVAFAAFIALVAYEWTASQSTQERVTHRIKESALNLFPALFATGFYLNLRFQTDAALYPTFSLTFAQQIGAALQALGLYTWMLLTPFQPNLYVGTLGIFVPWQIALGVVVAAGMFTAVIWTLRRTIHPTNATFLALCLAALFPVLHLIRIPIRPLAADRFMYLPYLGLCVFLFANWTRLPQRIQRPAAIVLALLALSFLGSTHKRNDEWSDPMRIWGITIGKMEQIAPKNGLAHSAMASVLSTQGRAEEALEYFEQAYSLEKQFQTLYPDYQVSHSLLAGWSVTLSTVGKFTQASETLAGLIATAPDQAEYRHLYASTLARMLNFEAADREFAAALRLYPQYAEAYTIRQQTRQAAQIWQQLPPETPNESTAIRAQRGFVYFLVGRLPDANQIWAEVVRAPDVTHEMLEQAKTILEAQRRLFSETADMKILADAIANQEKTSAEPALEKP